MDDDESLALVFDLGSGKLYFKNTNSIKTLRLL
jgi:hypothetical protein